MIPSPQKAGYVVSSGPQVRRHLAREGEARFSRIISLVHGERISWFSLWPSFEYFDIRKRPFTICMSDSKAALSKDIQVHSKVVGKGRKVSQHSAYYFGYSDILKFHRK